MEIDAEIAAQLGSIRAEVGASLGNVKKSVDRLITLNQQPVFSRNVFSATTDSKGNAVITLDKPSQGYFRQIRNVTVGSTTPNESISGSAYLYANGSPLSSYSLSSVGWIDYAASLPNVAFYGRGEIVQHDNEWLQLMVLGAPASTMIVANIAFEQWQDGAYKEGYTL